MLQLDPGRFCKLSAGRKAGCWDAGTGHNRAGLAQLAAPSLAGSSRLPGPFAAAQEGTGLKITWIVALLHGDLHQPGQLGALHALARVVVKVSPAPESRAGGDDAACVAVTRHRKRGSKVLQKKEYFTVLPNLVLKCLGEVPEDGVSREEDARVPATADPAANLTFNLRLSEAERQAKEAVPLPYQFSEEKKSSLLQTSTSEGKIYYEPDAADDIDEEDPDDDLDV